jgi:hypothetical protein
MCKNPVLRTQSLRAAVVLSALCGRAMAIDTCDVYRPGVPDFDQKRAVGLRPFPPHRPGLPNNGSLYCVPTSTVNRMAYIASNGYPAAIDGPVQDWRHDSSYEAVTEYIRDMGDLMSTDAWSGGTGNDGWKNGLRAWLDARVPGRFIVGHFGAANGLGPTPQTLRGLLAVGALVDIGYGRYSPEENNPGILTRSGGHACTVRHVYDACTTPEVALRNPSNSSSTVTQSAFDLSTSDMTTRTAVFRLSGGATQARTYWEFDEFNDGNAAPYRLLDVVNYICPIFGIDADPVLHEESVIHTTRPMDLTDSAHPTHSTVTIPGSGTLVDLQIDPRLHLTWVRDAGAAGAGPHVKVFDGTTGLIAGEFPLGTAIGPMVCGPDGDAYAVDGRTIRRLRLREGRIDEVGTRTIPFDPAAMAFNDSTGSVEIVDAHDYVLWRTNFGQSASTSRALPPGVFPCTDLTFSIDENGRLLLGCSSDIFEIGRDASGDLTVLSRVRLGSAARVKSIQATDAGLMYVDRGVVRELVRTPNGWAGNPDSLFDGRPSGPIFRIARSRWAYDNLDPGPAQTPEEDLPSERECPADFNEDGGIDGADVEAFFNVWEMGGETADVNADGGVDGADVESFFAAWGGGSCE